MGNINIKSKSNNKNYHDDNTTQKEKKKPGSGLYRNIDQTRLACFGVAGPTV